MIALTDKKNAAVVVCRGGSLRRVATSSFDGETIEAVDVTSDALGVTVLLEELENGPSPSIFEKVLQRSLHSGWTSPTPSRYAPRIKTDGQGTVKAANGSGEIACKRRAGDIASLREAVALGDIKELTHIDGNKNPSDPLTKRTRGPTMVLLRKMLYEGFLPV